MLTDVDLAARTRTAVDAAVRAARRNGLTPGVPRVLHDLFSVVVDLAPEPVVVRVPTVLPPGLDGAAQRAQQAREVAVCRWLTDTGHPAVAPAPAVPDQPVEQDGFSVTFWTRLDTVPTPEFDPVTAGAALAALHAALRPCPIDLAWMHPLDDSVSAMLDLLRDDPAFVSPADRSRALREWEAITAVLGTADGLAARYPDAVVQSLHGDAPTYNVLHTVDGPRDADFEHVTRGPVEWDLTFCGPEMSAAYAEAAGRPVDTELLALCEAARLVQLVACFALVPQQPSLGEGMRPMLDQWRQSSPCGGILDVR